MSIPATAVPRLLWSPKQAGEALGLTADGVKYLHRTGQLRGIVLSRHLMFRPADVQAFVEKLVPSDSD